MIGLSCIITYESGFSLGANHQLIPVNMPKNKAMAITQRDGPMRTDGNLGATPNYFPNSYSSVRDDLNFLDSNFTANDATIFRYDDKDENNYEQPRDLYNSFSPEWKERLHQNVAMAMDGVNSVIRERTLNELRKVDPTYADGVRTELNKMLKKSDHS